MRRFSFGLALLAAGWLAAPAVTLAQQTQSGAQQRPDTPPGAPNTGQAPNVRPGQPQTQPGPAPQGRVEEHGTAGRGEGSGDQHFVTKASQIDLAEVNLGRVGAQNASNPSVRQFGQKMVQDHTMSSAQLNQIANRKRLQPASRMDDEHQKLMDKLFGVRGPQFDQEYMKHMVMGHQKAVELYQHAAQNSQDDELKQFAAKTLPIVQQHLQMAQQISQSLGGGPGAPAAVGGQPGQQGINQAPVPAPGNAGAPRGQQGINQAPVPAPGNAGTPRSPQGAGPAPTPAPGSQRTTDPAKRSSDDR